MDEAVLEILKAVDDPEIGVDIVNLGLVYEASRDDRGVTVAMTATSRLCPLGEHMRKEAAERLAAAFPDALAIDVELVWSPAWTPERMSATARQRLAF